MEFTLVSKYDAFQKSNGFDKISFANFFFLIHFGYWYMASCERFFHQNPCTYNRFLTVWEFIWIPKLCSISFATAEAAFFLFDLITIRRSQLWDVFRGRPLLDLFCTFPVAWDFSFIFWIMDFGKPNVLLISLSDLRSHFNFTATFRRSLPISFVLPLQHDFDKKWKLQSL